MKLNQNLCNAVSKPNISTARNGCKKVVMKPVVQTTRKLLTAFMLVFIKPLVVGSSFLSVYP